VNIAEPGVTLTDYALTVECLVFVWLLRRDGARRGRARRWFAVFFAAVGFAAFAGGTSHGFLHDESSAAYRAVWVSTLIAIGVGAMAAWMLGALLVPSASAARWVRRAAVSLFAVYCAIVLFVMDTFVVAIVHYAPAAVFLFGAFVMRYRATGDAHFLSGVIGLVLTFVAAGVQQGGVGVHPVWLDHNALYHIVQAVGLVFLYRAARGIVRHSEGQGC
jgi:hypothetical protein